MTQHAFMDPWDGRSGLCHSAKRFDMMEDQVNGRFVGRIFLCGPGGLCGHCRRAMGQLSADIQEFLEEPEVAL